MHSLFNIAIDSVDWCHLMAKVTQLLYYLLECYSSLFWYYAYTFSLLSVEWIMWKISLNFYAFAIVRCGRYYVFEFFTFIRASRKFVNTIFYKLLGGISSNLQFWWTPDKYEPTRFWGQKVKGQGRDQAKEKRRHICISTAPCQVLCSWIVSVRVIMFMTLFVFEYKSNSVTSGYLTPPQRFCFCFRLSSCLPITPPRYWKYKCWKRTDFA